MTTDLKEFFVLLFSISLLACSKASDKPNEVEDTAGFATGKVTDSKGQPLKNAKIEVTNTSSQYYMSEDGTTDANGEYKIKLPKNTGNWTIMGSYETTYNNENYTLRLEPDVPNKVISSAHGAVTNFSVKLTGRQPSSSPGTFGQFNGGVINLNPGLDANIDMSDIMVYVEPIGPIIDGTTPAPTVITGLTHDPLLSYVINLPIGHWKITKITRKDKTPLFIRDYTNGIPDKNVSELDFYFKTNTGMYSSEAPLWVTLTVMDKL